LGLASVRFWQAFLQFVFHFSVFFCICFLLFIHLSKHMTLRKPNSGISNLATETRSNGNRIFTENQGIAYRFLSRRTARTTNLFFGGAKIAAALPNPTRPCFKLMKAGDECSRRSTLFGRGERTQD